MADTVDAHEPSWLVAVVGGPGAWGLARLDASTGDLRVTAFDEAWDCIANHCGNESPSTPADPI